MCPICQLFNVHTPHCPNGLTDVMAWSPSNMTREDTRTLRQGYGTPSVLTNAQVIAGHGRSRAADWYRALVATYGHDSLCDAYCLDRDGVNGGTYWGDVVSQALLHGDIDPDTLEIT